MAKIIKKYYADRKSPFALSWSEGQKRVSRFFETEEERDKFLESHSYLTEECFNALFQLRQETLADILYIESKRQDVSFKELWNFWQKHHKNRVSITVWDACNNYIKDMRTNDKASDEHIRHVIRILEKFCENFGDKLLTNITRKDLEKWLAYLPYSNVTKKNYRSTIRASFTFFENNDYIEKNIAKALPCPTIIREEIKFLSVKEAEHLLRANEKDDPEVCGLLALGLFGGMRSSAIPRVAYEEITFGQGILTPADKTKKGRRNYIENLPENLWAWLAQTPKTAYGWSERKWKKRKENAFRRAGMLLNATDVKKLNAQGKKATLMIPPKNAIRHSFASYHVAWKRDFQDTALIMSHKGTGILFEHYRGNTTEEEAKKYFNIYPLK